jgi:hypothetical protein
LIKKTSICDFGQGEIVIGAEELKAGIYVYTLIVDGALVDTKRMILTKKNEYEKTRLFNYCGSFAGRLQKK